MNASFATNFLSVIKNHVKNGGSSEVIDKYLSLLAEELKLATEQYNTILSIKALLGDLNEVETLHQKMKLEGNTDKLTDGIVCDAYAQRGKI